MFTPRPFSPVCEFETPASKKSLNRYHLYSSRDSYICVDYSEVDGYLASGKYLSTPKEWEDLERAEIENLEKKVKALDKEIDEIEKKTSTTKAKKS